MTGNAVCTDPNHAIIQKDLWTARVTFSRPVMFILAFVILIQETCGQQMWNPKRTPARRDSGFICEDDTRCICFSNLFVSRHCEGKVHIYQDEQSLLTKYQVRCEGESVADPYHYLSMARPGQHSNRGATLMIRGCPPPSKSYSELIEAGEENQTIHGQYVPVLTLDIDCGGLKTFQLTSRHLRGMAHLQSLEISCPKLSNLSVELLSEINIRAHRICISDTLIETFPVGLFSTLPYVVDLSLHHNRMRAVHASLLTGLQDLKDLVLSDNVIERLDDDVFRSTKKLTTLNIGGNLISELPSSLCALSELNSLDAKDNQIDSIPHQCLRDLVSLRFLELSGNRLLTLEHRSISLNEINSGHSQGEADYQSVRDLNDTLLNFSTTRQVASAGDTSQTAPSSTRITKQTGNAASTLFGSTSIVELGLKDNSLASLPANAFFGMGELREVDLSRNMIASLHPDMFVQNVKLSSLKVSDNQITEVPEMLLQNNAKLRILDFSGNQIRTLGQNFFSNITGLFSILLHNNRIEFLPDNIFKPFDIKLGPGDITMNTLVLSLKGNLLERIPLLTLPRLIQLDLSRNRLTHVNADDLKHVPYLETLGLSQNLIQSIGEQPGSPGSPGNELRPFFGSHLKKLTKVNLSGNRLTSFPNLEFIITNLKYLNLSGNQIPGFVSQCEGRPRDQEFESAVELLDLSNNSFHWPEFHDLCDWERAMVRSVRHLDLSLNRINITYCVEQMEPKRKVYGCFSCFRELEALEVIALSHNEINFVPMEFQHYLPKLRFADLSHNRIKRLWHHDFLITNGVTEDDLYSFDLDANHYVKRTGVDGKTYYEFPNSHHLTIDLRHNDIDTVDLPNSKIQIVRQDCEVERQYARATVLLGGNPLNCGCGVFKLLQYSLKEIRPISEREKYEGHRFVLPATIDIQDLHCSKPNSVSGKAVSEPETWAHHLLPLMGLCSHHEGMLRPRSDKAEEHAANSTREPAKGGPSG